MGGLSSKKAHRIECRDEFAQWTLDMVKEAYARARDLQKRRREAAGDASAIPADVLDLTKREFFDVFSAVGKPPNLVLSLSLDVFETFIDEPTFVDSDVFSDSGGSATLCRDGHPVVNAMEILLVMALLCEGETSEQLKFIYRAFDLDGSNGIDLDEMIVLFRVLTTAAWRINLTQRMATDAELNKLAVNMFAAADDDESGELSCEEFCEWAEGHVVSQRVLRSFKRVRTVTVNARSRSTRRPQSPKRASSPARSPAERMRRRVTKNKLKEQQRKEEHAKQVLRDIKKVSKFDGAELRRLRDVFAAAAGSIDAELTKPQFVKLLEEEYPGLADVSRPGAVALLFDAFDTDAGGSIDFKEFTVGLSRMTAGSLEERLKIVFDVYDTDGSAEISVVELLHFVASANSREESNFAHFAEHMIHTLDADGDGSITAEEFTTALRKDPSLFTFLVKPAAELNPFREVFLSYQRIHPDLLSLKRLLELWEGLSESGTAVKHCELQAFRTFFIEAFKMPTSLLPQVSQLYFALKRANDGKVTWATIFSNLMQLINGPVEERALLFFRIFSGGVDDMTPEDVVDLLLRTTKDEHAREVREVLDLLKGMDEDGSGSIGWEEFRSHAVSNPKVLATFSRLFGIDVLGVTSKAEIEARDKAFTKISSLLLPPKQTKAEQSRDAAVRRRSIAAVLSPKGRDTRRASVASQLGIDLVEATDDVSGAKTTKQKDKWTLERERVVEEGRRRKGVEAYRKLGWTKAQEVLKQLQEDEKTQQAVLFGREGEYRRAPASVIAVEHGRTLASTVGQEVAEAKKGRDRFQPDRVRAMINRAGTRALGDFRRAAAADKEGRAARRVGYPKPRAVYKPEPSRGGAPPARRPTSASTYLRTRQLSRTQSARSMRRLAAEQQKRERDRSPSPHARHSSGQRPQSAHPRTSAWVADGARARSRATAARSQSATVRRSSDANSVRQLRRSISAATIRKSYERATGQRLPKARPASSSAGANEQPSVKAAGARVRPESAPAVRRDCGTDPRLETEVTGAPGSDVDSYIAEDLSSTDSDSEAVVVRELRRTRPKGSRPSPTQQRRDRSRFRPGRSQNGWKREPASQPAMQGRSASTRARGRTPSPARGVSQLVVSPAPRTAAVGPESPHGHPWQTVDSDGETTQPLPTDEAEIPRGWQRHNEKVRRSRERTRRRKAPVQAGAAHRRVGAAYEEISKAPYSSPVGSTITPVTTEPVRGRFIVKVHETAAEALKSGRSGSGAGVSGPPKFRPSTVRRSLSSSRLGSSRVGTSRTRVHSRATDVSRQLRLEPV